MTALANGWRAVCRIDDIPRLGARRVARAGAVPIAIFRDAEDRVYALLDRCPHKGGPLSQGIVFGTSVACPLHNWTIGLDDGCAKSPDQGCVPRFAVKVEGDVVSLDAGELARSNARGPMECSSRPSPHVSNAAPDEARRR